MKKQIYFVERRLAFFAPEMAPELSTEKLDSKGKREQLKKEIGKSKPPRETESFTFLKNDALDNFKNDALDNFELSSKPKNGSVEMLYSNINQSDLLKRDFNPNLKIAFKMGNSPMGWENGVFVMTGETMFIYTPKKNFVGKDQFKMTDGHGQTITIDVDVQRVSNVITFENITDNSDFLKITSQNSDIIQQNDGGFEIREKATNKPKMTAEAPKDVKFIVFFDHTGELQIGYEPNKGFVGTTKVNINVYDENGHKKAVPQVLTFEKPKK